MIGAPLTISFQERQYVSLILNPVLYVEYFKPEWMKENCDSP